MWVRIFLGTDGARFRLPIEYLRVYSPSAEVRRRPPHEARLQIGKDRVKITDLHQAGNYAVKLFFDDGRSSVLSDWRYRYKPGRACQPLWLDCRERLKAAGEPRPGTIPLRSSKNGVRRFPSRRDL
jgi:DUF971 family protein